MTLSSEMYKISFRNLTHELSCFKVQSRHLPGTSEYKDETLTQDSRSLSQDLNSGPSEYDAEYIKRETTKQDLE
jgi:hypothetical protein